MKHADLYKQLVVLIVVFSVVACSSYGVPERALAVQHPADVRAALHAQHQSWRGTPYRLGGMSRRGIDCSGFVAKTFQTHFDRALPRTTELQARAGMRVHRNELLAGDLVFFRTGRNKRHVGIYVEDGQFLHASTSQGVTLSSLDNPYWQPRFWQARRL